MPRRRNDALSIGYHQGTAATCAVLAREHGEPDDAAMLRETLDPTVADLEAQKADSYDLEPLPSLNRKA
jgi:hypothetical protein